MRVVLKDFPLPNHPEARKAAEAAHCAGDQKKYWEMHDLLFLNQSDLTIPKLKGHAVALKLDAATFGQCLDSGKYADAVNADFQYGQRIGVESTPTVYINGRQLLGAQPFEALEFVINEELARKPR